MKKNLIAASVLLCMALLTACGGESSVSGTLSLAENTETTTTASETTTADTTAAAETTTAADTTAAGEDTTAAPAENTADTTAAQAQETTSSASATESSSASSSSTTQTTAQQTSGVLFDELRPGLDCTAYVTAHPVKPATAPSCLGDGEDRTYTYSNLIIMSYFENGKDIVQEIDLTDSGVKTRAGIEVGMKKSDVVAAYGEPAGGQYIYHTSDGVLEIHMGSDGETVSEIWLYTE